MRKKDIDSLVIHCTATREGQNVRASDINKWHQERGFKTIGYNYVICLDGTIEKGRPLTIDGAHCSLQGFSGKSYNKHSIGIVYVGGLDHRGNPKDTRTYAQKKAMCKLVYQLLDEYTNIKEIIGHRDASPDINHDGEITSNEWVKQCPCFEVKAEFPVSMIIALRRNERRNQKGY